ncbi:tRNA-binding protein, partial [Vibrio parahaemolyticus]|nr:tRNA-binding protein [Vibrio parahaemolyticus]
MQIIEWDDFTRVEMRVGTIISAELNSKAKKPAYVMEVDLGELGI